MRILCFVILFSWLPSFGFAAAPTTDARPSALIRCVRYLAANGKRTIHRARYGRDTYRARHNLREVQRLIEQTTAGKVPNAIHADHLRYEPYLKLFAAKYNGPGDRPPAIFLFNTVGTYLYDVEGFPTPSYYEPGVILVIRQQDQLVQTALRTEMLDELYKIRSTRAQLGVAIRNVDAMEAAERSSSSTGDGTR